jgi:peroxiredoxin
VENPVIDEWIFFFGTNTIVATTTLNEDAYELILDTTTICENVSFEENIIASDNDMLYDIAMDNPFQEKGYCYEYGNYALDEMLKLHKICVNIDSTRKDLAITIARLVFETHRSSRVLHTLIFGKIKK